ncbi:hypothetical protein ILYODFUR_014082 [Ilyodon furcidens]|uniref:Pre-mRNA polyadenylation factor Fip1 domain-containing protein n=1 Tax=Ilyodon furcidens TaxID=33524 RepID=A0ABV0V5B2_9TELE
MSPDEDDDKMFQWKYDSHDRETENHHSPHSSGHTPEFSSEMRTDPVGCTKEEDKDVFQNIYEVKQLAQEVQPVEEKPWRKSGADISDYFNYGFNEESWKTYCRKYAKLQAFQTQHIAKVMRERAKYEEVVSCASSTSGRPSKKSSRQRKASSTGRGGKAGSRRREKERPCCTNAARDTQVVAEISHKKNNVANYDLPRSINADTVFSFVPPPCGCGQKVTSCCPHNSSCSCTNE